MTFIESLLENPDAVKAQAEAVLQNGLEQVRRMAGIGIDVMLTASDLADNRGQFFSPDQMNRFILPFLSQWVDEIRSLNAFPILHTDGNINAILNDLANTGIAGLQAIDPVAGMDILEVHNQIGDCVTVCGNVDCGLLQNGTPEAVNTTTEALIHQMKGKSLWIIGASNAVQTETPKENYDAMLEARLNSN